MVSTKMDFTTIMWDLVGIQCFLPCHVIVHRGEFSHMGNQECCKGHSEATFWSFFSKSQFESNPSIKPAWLSSLRQPSKYGVGHEWWWSSQGSTPWYQSENPVDLQEEFQRHPLCEPWCFECWSHGFQPLSKCCIQSVFQGFEVWLRCLM